MGFIVWVRFLVCDWCGIYGFGMWNWVEFLVVGGY